MTTKIDYMEYDLRRKERMVENIDKKVVIELKKKKGYLEEIKELRKKLKEVYQNA